jgi:cytochrome b pre-mRNA-processing protein 3
MTSSRRREETQKQPDFAQASHDLRPDSEGPTVAQMQEAIRKELTQQSPVGRIAQSLLKNAPSTTQTYVVYGTTERLFKSCGAQAPYTIPEGQRTKVLTGQGPPRTEEGEDIGVPDATDTLAGAGSVFWHEQLGMLPTFSTWSLVTYLHFYILLVHLRTLSDHSSLQMHQRYLIEHFSQSAEDKMVLLHTIEARGIRNRYLKDLFIQWRGCIAAYDEGLVKGDAVLGAAIWRNVFKGEEQVDWEKVAVVVAYMRRCINLLSEVDDVEEVAAALDGPEGIWARAQQGLFAEVEQLSQGMQEAPDASS